MSRILITGAAGFIGFHLSQRLLNEGHEIIGIDNLNDYYDVSLKNARLDILKKYSAFTFSKIDIAEKPALDKIFAGEKFDTVIHLAAQAGVRYSIDNPSAYINSNLVGFGHILECCRAHPPRHFLYASSSSVYGANVNSPFKTSDNVDHPLSLYAATKKANELMAHTYANLYGLPCTGLRFFTVYGPFGRPDMAYFKFADAMMKSKPIDIFNNGDMLRDFTYIDDIVDGIVRLIPVIPQTNKNWDRVAADPSTSFAPYRVYNIGNNKPEKLMDMIALLEKEMGIEAIKNYLPMQPGDVPATYADIDDLTTATGFKPTTTLAEGLHKFTTWFKDYYKI